MLVTNNSKTPLGLPGNTLLAPNESRAILNWETIKSNRVVASWLNRGTISVSDAPEQEEPQDPPEPSSGEQAEKDDLIASLKEFGINRDRRSSVEKLRAELDEALAADSDEVE